MNLHTLREVYAAEGPFVTVHVDVGWNAEDAQQQLEARCTNLRQQLTSDEVDEKLVDEFESRLRDSSGAPAGTRRTIIAAGGTVLFDDSRTSDVSAPESVSVGPLPDVAGWLEQAAAEIPFLLVVTDREGADLQVHVATGQSPETESQVDGDTLHITKIREGGLAHARYQRRAENVWRSNARDVVEEIQSLSREHAPELVVLAGDVRARTEIVKALGSLDAPVEQIEAGARSEGASEESLWSEIDDLLARHADRRVEDTLEEIGTAYAHGRAVHGVDDVLDALVRGEVDRLVLELDATRSIEVAPERFPGLPLPGGAAGHRDRLPADRLVLAAAAATDAAVQLVPGTPEESDGVSALLRWARDDG